MLKYRIQLDAVFIYFWENSMHKNLFLALLTLTLATACSDALAKAKTFNADGEVVSVDPVYSSVTVEHKAIKGFSGAGQTAFIVTDKAVLKSLTARDLIEFEITQGMGEVVIDKIRKTGVAPEKSDSLPIGKTVQGALESTAGAAKSLTEPIAPAHHVVSGTMDATTNATGAVLDDATNEVKTKF